MLSGSDEFQFFDINSQSSHLWAQAIERSSEVTGSDVNSQDIYIGYTGSDTVTWGGGKIFFSSYLSVANSASLTCSDDIDFRYRYVTFIDGWGNADAGPLHSDLNPLASRDCRTTNMAPFYGRNGTLTLLTHTGAYPGSPIPTQGTYYSCVEEGGLAGGYIYCDHDTHALCFYNNHGSALSMSFVFLVSDQIVTRT